MEVSKSRFTQLLRSPEEQKAQAQDKLKEVSQMYEKHFLNEMVKAMRSTVNESGLVKVSQGERIFREQLDQEYVGAWSNRGGIGLSDLIYEQLMQKFGAQLGLDNSSGKVARPQGPLPLDEASNYHVRSISGLNKITTHLQRADKKNSDEGEGRAGNISSVVEPVPISSPWSGKLVQKIDLGIDEYFLQVSHENGLRSDLKWKGSLSPGLQAGADLYKGQPLGYLGQNLDALTWAISSQNNAE
jgi:flagellar protein FlgJ